MAKGEKKATTSGAEQRVQRQRRLSAAAKKAQATVPEGQDPTEYQLAVDARAAGVTKPDFIEARTTATRSAATAQRWEPAVAAAAMADVEMAADAVWPLTKPVDPKVQADIDAARARMQVPTDSAPTAEQIATAERAKEARQHAKEHPAYQVVGAKERVEATVRVVSIEGGQLWITLDRKLMPRRDAETGRETAASDRFFIPAPTYRRLEKELDGQIGRLRNERVELSVRDDLGNLSNVRLLGPVAITPDNDESVAMTQEEREAEEKYQRDMVEVDDHIQAERDAEQEEKDIAENKRLHALETAAKANPFPIGATVQRKILGVFHGGPSGYEYHIEVDPFAWQGERTAATTERFLYLSTQARAAIRRYRGEDLPAWVGATVRFTVSDHMPGVDTLVLILPSEATDVGRPLDAIANGHNEPPADVQVGDQPRTETALEALLAGGDVVALDVNGTVRHFWSYSGILKLLDRYKAELVDANGVVRPPRLPKLQVPKAEKNPQSYAAEAKTRLEAKLDRDVKPGHAIFTGTTHPSAGFGMMYYDGQMRPAHRVAWTLAKGEIPEGMNVTHRKEVCTEKLCCEVEHLQLTPKKPGKEEQPADVPPREPKAKKPLVEVRNGRDLEKAIEPTTDTGAKAPVVRSKPAAETTAPEVVAVRLACGFEVVGTTTRTDKLNWMSGEPHHGVARFAFPRQALPAAIMLCKVLGYDGGGQLSDGQRDLIARRLGLRPGEVSRWAGALDGVARKLEQKAKKADGPLSLYELTQNQAERFYLALMQWNARQTMFNWRLTTEDQDRALAESVRFLAAQLLGTKYTEATGLLEGDQSIHPSYLPTQNIDAHVGASL